MLIVCNGAPKSGSTWLYNILTNIVECEKPDSKYLTKNSKHPCIRPDMFEEFLSKEDFKSQNYITKNHLSGKKYRDLLLNYNDIYIFDIERDPRDVVVSMYFDACNRNDYNKPFSNFYWQIGREEVAMLSTYHSVWKNAGHTSYVANYENLQDNFSVEVQAIADILSIKLNSQEIIHIQSETSMDTLRKKYSDQDLYKGDKFFRKGIVGDWKNHFDDQVKEDIEKILINGISPFDSKCLINKIKVKFSSFLSKF